MAPTSTSSPVASPQTSAVATATRTADPAPRVSPVAGYGTGTPVYSSPTAAPPQRATAGTTVVTHSDTGTTIHVRRGDHVEVRLTQDSYDPPTSSDAAVASRQSSEGGYPSSAPVDAVFAATGAGTADLTAFSDYACFHSSPMCLRPTRTWVVHVVVQ